MFLRSKAQLIFCLVLLLQILQPVESVTRTTSGYDAVLGDLSRIPVYQTDIESVLYNPDMWEDQKEQNVYASFPFAWQKLFDLIPDTDSSEPPQEPLVFRALEYAGWQVYTVKDKPYPSPAPSPYPPPASQMDDSVNLNLAVFYQAIRTGPLGNLVDYLGSSDLILQYIVFSRTYPFYISSNRPRNVNNPLPRSQANRNLCQWTDQTIMPSNIHHTATYGDIPLGSLRNGNSLFFCFTTPSLRDQFYVFTRLFAATDATLSETSTSHPMFLLESPRFSPYIETPSDAIAALLRLSTVATLLSDQMDTHNAISSPHINLFVPRSPKRYTEATKLIKTVGAQSFIANGKVKSLSAVFSSIAASTNFVDVDFSDIERTSPLHLYRLQRAQDITDLNMTVMFTCPNENPYLVRMVCLGRIKRLLMM